MIKTIQCLTLVKKTISFSSKFENGKISKNIVDLNMLFKMKYYKSIIKTGYYLYNEKCFFRVTVETDHLKVSKVLAFEMNLKTYKSLGTQLFFA